MEASVPAGEAPAAAGARAGAQPARIAAFTVRSWIAPDHTHTVHALCVA